jgi:hypothetical protein
MVDKTNMRNTVSKKLTSILSDLDIEQTPLELSNFTCNSLVSKFRKKVPIFFSDESFDLIKQTIPPQKIGTVHINYKHSCAKVITKLIGSNCLSEQDKFDNYRLELVMPYSLLSND